jgi:predicted PurR-regulated permease PerM
MESDPSSMPTSGEVFYARTFILVTLSVLGFLLYRIVQPFLGPFAWALFIAFLLHPLHAWLVARLHGRASLSATLLTIATLLLLLGPLTALGAAFAAQLADLLQYAQRFAAEHRPANFADIRNIPVLGMALTWLERTLDITVTQIQGWVIEAARNVLRSLGSLGREVFLGALGTVIGFAIMMFILFFTIRDGERAFAALRALIPMSGDHKARLFEHLAGVTRALVFGTGVTAAVQGALVAIGFAIVGLPSPIVFGVLAALFALIPLAGTPVVWVPAVIVLAAQQRWYAAIFLLIWGGLVVTVDNVLRPLLVSGRAHVGTLTVFVGVLGGVSAFGAIGVFLGPLVLALVTALIRFALEVRGAAKEIPRA